jgi:hypothetical protein
MDVPESLEVVLEGKLDYPAAMFVRYFSEVIQRRLGESEPASRIAEVGPCLTRPAIRGRRDALDAFGLEDEVDIAISSITNIDPSRIRLVENIEESTSELDLLVLGDLEILEERDIEVTPARTPYIKRRLRRS